MRKHLHFLCLFRRQLAADRRVYADQLFIHCLLQCSAAGGMAGANQTIGHAGAVSFDLAFSAVLFEVGVKFLQIALRQLVQRYLTDRGNDVQIDAVFVAKLCGKTYMRFGIGLVPELHPFSEGHIRRGFSRDNADLLLECVELFLTCRFGFGGYIFCFRLSVVVVTYDDSAFPSSVFAQTKGSLSCFSPFCHGCKSLPNNSSMKSPTTAEAFFCISVVTWV